MTLMTLMTLIFILVFPKISGDRSHQSNQCSIRRKNDMQWQHNEIVIVDDYSQVDRKGEKLFSHRDTEKLRS